MSKPFFSIVTTTFNAENYIGRLIQSLNSQIFRSFEHIIVDAGSTDNTVGIINSIHPSAKLLTLENSSMYEAINFGFDHANGIILSYLNADDMYLSDTLSTVYDLHLVKSFDFLVGATIFVDDQYKTLYKYKPIVTSFVLIHRLHRIPFTQPSSFWTKRAFKKLSGFNTQYRYCADTDFFLRALNLDFHFESTDKYLSLFMRHRSSLSSLQEVSMSSEHNHIFAVLKNRIWRRRTIKENIHFFLFYFYVYIKNLEGILRRQYYFKTRGVF